MSIPLFATAPLPNESQGGGQNDTPLVKESNPCDISVQECIKKYFPDDYRVALAVATAESHLNNNAKGFNYREKTVVVQLTATTTSTTIVKYLHSTDCGIFQVNNYYHPGSCGWSVEENIAYARKYQQAKGWSRWTTFRNGDYLKYLTVPS